MSLRIICMTAFLIGFSAMAVGGEFVPGIAVKDAGQIADKDKKKFYAYYMTPDGSAEDMKAELTKNLADAATAKANFAVFGADYALNAKILRAALEAAKDGGLNGATILYVGGGEPVDDLKALATTKGAAFRSTIYSGK